MEIDRRVDRAFLEAAETFAGPVTSWLPVIAGPEVGSWRAETEEGPVVVPIVIEAGAVFVPPDQVRWRSLEIRPDPTARQGFLATRLTPTVRGQLGLRRTDDGTAELMFRGEPESRSLLTSWMERLLVGNLLSRSAVETLLDHIAERLAVADGRDETGNTSGTVRCAVPAH